MKELKIIYHPIEQRIKIKEKHPQGNWIDIKKNPKEKFLQDLPGDFFNNIFKDFGEKNIQISFKGTDMDYADLKQMVDFYNGKNENTKLSLLENFEKIPAVEDCYSSIKNTSKKILCSIQSDISKESDTEIKQRFSEVSTKVEAAANKEDEPIHLCFIGAYSTGKSTLINALLGSKILPDADEAKTAKIFKIVNCKNVSLELKLAGKDSEEYIKIEVNNQTNSFQTLSTCSDKKFKDELNYRIANSQNNNESIEAQLQVLLDFLNDQEIVIEITINYPIDFLNDKKCVIYDTPGADSDESKNHEAVLGSILNQQKNCILFIVLSPTKTEGTGNRRVFELLSDAESTKTNSNGINLSMERCFYVFNMADTLKSDSYKAGLADKELKIRTVVEDEKGESKESDSKVIKMANHRVFLTSSAWGLAASKKYHYDEDDKDDFIHSSQKKSFYEKNLGIREQDVKELIDYCNREKEEATDEDKKLLIASGIFALQKAIHDYVNKYSTAIHANRFFTEIKKPIEDYSASVDNLSENLSTDVSKLKEEQEKLTTKIVIGLDDLLEIEKAKLDEIKFDSKLIPDDRSKEINKYIDEKLKNVKLSWTFGKKSLEQKMNVLESDISIFINGVIKNMNEAYEDLRNQKKEEFRQLVIEYLKNNGVSSCKISALTSEKAKASNIKHAISTFIWSWVKDKESYNGNLKDKACAEFYNANEIYQPENIKKTLKIDLEDYITEIKENIEKESSEIKAVIEKRENKEFELSVLKPVSEKLENYIKTLMESMNMGEDDK